MGTSKVGRSRLPAAKPRFWPKKSWARDNHDRRRRHNISNCTIMAKKRKIGSGAPKAPKEEDPRMKINTFEDVADSEDEFHMNRDKVLLDEGPVAKKMRKYQEEG